MINKSLKSKIIKSLICVKCIIKYAYNYLLHIENINFIDTAIIGKFACTDNEISNDSIITELIVNIIIVSTPDFDD